MAPNEVHQSPIYVAPIVSPGEETYDEEGAKFFKLKTDPDYKHRYIPAKVIIFTLLHAGAFYGLYSILTFQVKIQSIIWALLVGLGSLIGGILGGHRGFTHNAFKVTTFGKVMLIIFQTVIGQNDIYWWARDHRLHHKFVDTDADPYNAKRGLFFSHIGWLMAYKHPLVKEKGTTIDMSDLKSDKLIMFQRKYYIPMFVLFNIVIPVAVPVYFWNENFWMSFSTAFMYRYVHILHSTWMINSIAHHYGPRPFDGRVSARMSKIGDIITLGDGWHNYHHVFPTHAGISEYGYGGGFATNFLHLMEKLGIAYDLKEPTKKVIHNHSRRHGDGSITFDELNLKSN